MKMGAMTEIWDIAFTNKGDFLEGATKRSARNCAAEEILLQQAQAEKVIL